MEGYAGGSVCLVEDCSDPYSVMWCDASFGALHFHGLFAMDSHTQNTLASQGDVVWKHGWVGL